MLRVNVRIKELHDWNVPYKEAIELQKRLVSELSERAIDISSLKTVAGVDVSTDRDSPVIHAAVVVLNFHSLELVCQETASVEVTFPYIPGLLSFREGPAVIEAFRKLSVSPDAVIFDGQGYAHPRRLGLASHLGLWLGVPTIGCAKSRLTGDYEPPKSKKGAYAQLTDKGEVIGAVITTRENVKPVFVSRGHLSDLDSAIEIVLRTAPRYRLPEPIRAAHLLSNKIRKNHQRINSI